MIVLCLPLASARAGDVTGRWTGVAETTQNGATQQFPVLLKLVQSGDGITGSAYVEGKDWPIEHGKADGARVELVLVVPNDTIRFKLLLAGDRLTGTITGGKPDGPVVTLDLKRKVVAPPAFDLSGKWSGAVSHRGDKSLPIVFQFRQAGNRLAGEVIGNDGVARAFEDGEIDGAMLTFSLNDTRSADNLRFALVAAGDTITGFGAGDKGGKESLLDISVTRVAKAAGVTGGSDPAGEWSGSVEVEERGQSKNYPLGFRFQRDGSSITGVVVTEQSKLLKIQEGTLIGNRLTFTIDSGSEHVRFTLTIDGDNLTGQAVTSRSGSDSAEKITAVRRVK